MPSLSAVHPQRSVQFLEIGPTIPKINRARPIVGCLIWTLILLSLAISVCSVIAWFIFHPRVPVIQINSLSVSNLTVRAEAGMGFTVTNENSKMDLQFSKFNVRLLYKNRGISMSHFESFSLQKKNQTSKNVEFAVNMSMIKKEVISFSVSMEGCVSITYGNWYSKKKSMEIYCKDLKVDFSTDGKGKLNSDQKHDCSVHFV